MKKKVTKLKNPITTATSLEKQHKPFSKQWDCYNDQPDNEHNEIKSAIVTAKSIIKALQKNATSNAGLILYYRSVWRSLVRKLGKLEFEEISRTTKSVE